MVSSMAALQDVVAIAVAAAAAAWLVRRAFSSPGSPGCKPPASSGPEGFVPLDALAKPSGKLSHRR